MSCVYLTAMLLVMGLTISCAATVLTKEMENIFLMLEKKARLNRENVVKQPPSSVLETGAGLSIKIQRHASPSIVHAKNFVVRNRGRPAASELPLVNRRYASSSIREAKSSHAKKWDKLNLTYKLHGHPSSLSKLETRRVFYKAFKIWSRHSQLRFHEVADVAADINIRFEARHHGDGEANAFDGPNGHLAHTLPPPSGELHFDSEDFWSSRSYRRRYVIVSRRGKRELKARSYYSLLLAAVHEIGHVIGLEHNSVIESIMYPLYARKAAKGRLKLHSRDVEAIQSLYGPHRNSDPLAPPPDFIKSMRRKSPKPAPDPCRTSIDAAFCDGEVIHSFRDRFHWTWNSRTDELSSPQKFKLKFQLSKPHVNAACYSAFSGRTYLFSGKKYWRYHGNNLETGYPRLSSGHGLPSRPAVAFHIPDTEDLVVIKRKKMYIFDEISETVKTVKRIIAHDGERQADDRLAGERNLTKSAYFFRHTAVIPLDGIVTLNGTTYFFKRNLVYSTLSVNLPRIFLNSTLFASLPTDFFPRVVPWIRNCVQ